MSDWRITTLGQEVDLLIGNPFKSAQYTDDKGDILLLRGDNIGQGFLRWENAKRWSIEKTEGIEDYFLQEDDVVLAMDRPWIEAGLKFAYLSQDDLPCLLVQRVSRLRAKEKLNQTFLRYVIQGYEFTQYIIKTQTGTAVPHISGTQIKDFKFLIPPLSEQEEIAKTLGILDRKIENLRKQNETLEVIAQTLFKHWFVDFEFLNEDGKPYKSSGGAMVRSQLGEIPVGWRVGKLEDICKIINGFAFKSQDYRDDGIKIIRTKNFSEAGFIEPNDLVFISKAQLDKYSGFELRKFDFLMVMVGASIGKFVVTTSHILPALQNQNMWNFRAIAQESQMFLNYSLKILISQHSNSATGSAREFFRKDYFYKISIILPDDAIIKAFSIFCLRLASKVDLNIRQIQSLTKTRDVLLPKLMSGKLRITE